MEPDLPARSRRDVFERSRRPDAILTADPTRTAPQDSPIWVQASTGCIYIHIYIHIHYICIYIRTHYIIYIYTHTHTHFFPILGGLDSLDKARRFFSSGSTEAGLGYFFLWLAKMKNHQESEPQVVVLGFIYQGSILETISFDRPC